MSNGYITEDLPKNNLEDHIYEYHVFTSCCGIEDGQNNWSFGAFARDVNGEVLWQRQEHGFFEIPKYRLTKKYELEILETVAIAEFFNLPRIDCNEVETKFWVNSERLASNGRDFEQFRDFLERSDYAPLHSLVDALDLASCHCLIRHNGYANKDIIPDELAVLYA